MKKITELSSHEKYTTFKNTKFLHGGAKIHLILPHTIISNNIHAHLLYLLAIAFSPRLIYWAEICCIRSISLQICHCRGIAGTSPHIPLVLHLTVCHH